MNQRLKKALTVSAIIFFIASTIGIFVAVSENTKIFHNVSYLTCGFKVSALSNESFTLTIPKNGENIIWSDSKVERKVKSVSDTSLTMGWKNDVGSDVMFVLNRLTGDFRMEVDKGDAIYGECHEASPKF